MNTALLHDDVDEQAIQRLADRLVDEHQNLMLALVSMRKKHKLTQAEVAERMGVSQPTVAAFERYDSNPRLSTIRRYALAVGARIQERVTDDLPSRTAAAAVEQVTSLEPWLVEQPRAIAWQRHAAHA